MKEDFSYNRSYGRNYAEPKAFGGKQLFRLFAYLAPYRYWVGLCAVLLLASKAIEALVPIYIGNIVERVLEPDATDSVFFSAVLWHCLFILALLTVAYLLDSLIVLIKNWVGQRALYTLRGDVYSHALKVPLEFYNKNAVGTLMTRTIHDVEQINQMFTESVVPLIGSFLLLVCITIGLFIVNYQVALLLAFILPFMFWLTEHFRFHQRRCYDKIRGIVAVMNAFVQEHLMGASTVRSFGLHEAEKRSFDEINADYRTANVETIHHFAFFIAGIDFFQSVSLIGAFIVLVYFSPVETGFQAGTFFTFSLYVIMLFRPLADLAERYNLLQSSMAAASRIFSLLDVSAEDPGPAGGETIPLVESIDFEDVWFAYKEEQWILKGLSFSLKRGESVALVGVTGAGKTTILNLLLRFYDYQKGSIRINGKELRSYPLQELRRHFSIVLQDPEIFSGTIADNVCLGQSAVDAGKLHEVAAFLNLSPFLNSLPQGWETFLSERGKSLSAGQRQLVSMARAVAQGRSVLVLDEATANIDSKTEKLIQDALKKMIREKTALVIAHRLSTIKDVDRIVVLHHGTCLETGSHEELLRRKGIYEKLYRLQFAKKL